MTESTTSQPQQNTSLWRTWLGGRLRRVQDWQAGVDELAGKAIDHSAAACEAALRLSQSAVVAGRAAARAWHDLGWEALRRGAGLPR
jgi:hypothetical protein